jgi:hypothetical protein
MENPVLQVSGRDTFYNFSMAFLKCTMTLRKKCESYNSVGLHYTCCICSNGSIWTWGRPIRGQLGRDPEPQDHPKSVNIDASAISISTNEGITLVAVRNN